MKKDFYINLNSILKFGKLSKTLLNRFKNWPTFKITLNRSTFKTVFKIVFKTNFKIDSKKKLKNCFILVCLYNWKKQTSAILWLGGEGRGMKQLIRQCEFWYNILWPPVHQITPWDIWVMREACSKLAPPSLEWALVLAGWLVVSAHWLVTCLSIILPLCRTPLNH